MADRGLSPRVSGTVDLGSASKAWRKVYLSDDGLAKLQNDFSSDAGAHNSIYRGKELPYTWAELQAKVQAGDFSDLYIGDYKTITLTTNEVVICEIAGINTYTKSGVTAAVGNHIDFISRDCLAGGKRMNSTGTNNGTSSENHPWRASELFQTLNDVSTGVYSLLSSDLKAVIIDKTAMLEERYSAGGTVSADTNYSAASLGKLWLPAEIEVFGSPSWSDIGYGTGGCGVNIQYSIFKFDMEHMIKRNGNGAEACQWWTLSAVRSDASKFCAVNMSGDSITPMATNSWVKTPLCFRIG